MEEHVRWLNNEPDENGEVRDEWRADFSGANLEGALLPKMPLYGANFRGANLAFADLTGSDLCRADLTGANLYYACLFRACVHDAAGIPCVPLPCPDTGAFIGWKQALYKHADGEIFGRVIVKVLIPEDAKRMADTKRECRTDKMVVLEIQNMDGTVLIDGPSEDCAVSIKDRKTEYRVGETVTVDKVDEEDFFRYDGTAWHHKNGLFFYTTRREAELYMTGGYDPDGRPIDIMPQIMAILQKEREVMGWDEEGEKQ